MTLKFPIGPCRVEVRFSCFALLAFFCLFGGASGGASFLAACLLHEGAHLCALFCFGVPPRRAELSAFGCRMERDSQKPLQFWQNALVSLAGPCLNLLCFGLLALLGRGEGDAAQISLALGLLHLLPIEPLDGGLALRYLLSGCFSPGLAEKVTLAFSLFLLFPLAALGFLLLLRTRYNFSLLALCVYLMLYLTLKRDDLSF